MNSVITIKGIVVSESVYKENDKMLTVITSENGKISVSAKGAKKTNSRFLACAQEFCYSSMTLYQGRNGIYTLSDCSLIDSFYNLRCDYDTLMSASDIAKLASKVSQEECSDPELMRLLLNTFHFLCDGKKNRTLLECIFKIRLVAQQGFLDIEKIGDEADAFLAARHIAESPMEKLFAFNVSETVLVQLKKFADISVSDMLESE